MARLAWYYYWILLACQCKYHVTSYHYLFRDRDPIATYRDFSLSFWPEPFNGRLAILAMELAPATNAISSQSSAVLSRPQPSSAAFRNSAFSSSGRSVVFHRKCCGPSASCSQKTRGSWMAYEPKWIKCVNGSGNIKTIQWQIWLNLKESRSCFLWLMFTSKTSSSVLPDWHKRKTPCSVELRKRGRRHWLQIEGWVHLKPWQEGSVVCTSSHSNGWSIQ